MNVLRDLKITRIDRCWKGLNPEAEITLFKSKAAEPPSKKEPSVAEEQIDKALAEKVLALETEVAAAKETLAALDEMDNDTLAALKGFEIAKSEPADDVLKGLPEEVRERLTKAEARVEQIEKERRAEQFKKAAAEYPHVGSQDEVAAILEAVDGDEQVAKSLTQIFKAVNARIDKGDLFTELGEPGALSEDDPIVKVRAQVAELRKSDSSLSEADATARVLRENTDLADAWFASTEKK